MWESKLGLGVKIHFQLFQWGNVEWGTFLHLNKCVSVSLCVFLRGISYFTMAMIQACSFFNITDEFNQKSQFFQFLSLS